TPSSTHAHFLVSTPTYHNVCFFVSITRRPPTSALFPYTTLFRSLVGREVDTKTGTIQIAGAFPNPGNVLRPGQYAKVRVALDVKKGAILVPQRSVSELQGSYQVAVVGPYNKVTIKVV